MSRNLITVVRSLDIELAVFSKIILVVGLCWILVFEGGLDMATAQTDGANYDEAKVPAYTLPKIMGPESSSAMVTANTWERVRRPEVLALFEEHVYGDTLPGGIAVEFREIESTAVCWVGLQFASK